MIHLLVTKIATSISKRLQYDDLKGQWLQYGLETICGKLINSVVILSLACIMDRFFEALIFLCVFSLLRKYTGGFHMANDTKCSVVSIILCFSVVLMATHLDCLLMTTISLFLAFLGTITICVFAPINHPDLRLTMEESSVLQKRARFVVVVSLSAFLPLMKILPYRYAIVGNSAITCVAVLIIVAKITGQEEMMKNEKNDSHF